MAETDGGCQNPLCEFEHDPENEDGDRSYCYLIKERDGSGRPLSPIDRERYLSRLEHEAECINCSHRDEIRRKPIQEP